MKKTLITMMALLSCTSFAAEESYAMVVDFTKGAPTNVGLTTDKWIPAGATSVPGITLEGSYADTLLSTISASATAEIQATKVDDTDYTKHLFLRSNNIGLGATVTYTLTFTAGDDFTVDTLTYALFTFNSVGKTNTNDIEVNANATISTIGIDPVAKSGSFDLKQQVGTGADSRAYANKPTYTFASNSITGGSGGFATFQFDEAITLTKGTAYTIDLSLSKKAGPQGFFVGIGGIQMTGTYSVPEPATATLSLLALAGLAARRRRASH